MGKRVVITSFGSYGDVFPYIGLALALRERGHDPVLAMPAYYREMVELEGLGFHPVRPNVDPTDTATVRRIMDTTRGTEFIVKQLIVPSLRDSYADLSSAVEGADLLVTHPITFAGPILAEREGLPWVSTVLAPMSFFSPHDLPVFPPAPWVKRFERFPGAGFALAAAARSVTRRWVEPVQALRAELGLPCGANPIFEGQHSPDLVLALFSRVLADPQADWPSQVRITGAVDYNGPSGNSRLSSRLESFLGDGPAPAVFTLGSSAVGSAGSFYSESVEAVRRLGIRAVLLVGPHPENRPSGPLPDGVLLEDFAPHGRLFPRASVVVHQGGAGTLHQALLSGRPTLVVPFAHDQPDNAYRVERLGVSRTLRPPRYEAKRVQREIGKLLEQEEFAARAAIIAERVRAEGGAAAAADAIDRLLSGVP